MKIMSSYDLKPTRDNVTKPNGCHGDETEVETFKEGPIFPECEEESTKAEEDAKEDKSSPNSVHIVTEPHLLVIIFISAKNRFMRKKML